MGHPPIVKALLMTVTVLVGIIVGLVTGILSRAGGSSVPAAIRHGGVAFGGTVSLVILIMTTLDHS